LLGQVLETIKQENKRRNLEIIQARYLDFLEQCREPFITTEALYLGSHVRLYPYYDAIESLREFSKKIREAPKPGRNVSFLPVLGVVLISALATVWIVSRPKASRSLDLISDKMQAESVHTVGLDDLESEKGFTWRWSLGATTVIKFVEGSKDKFNLVLSVNNSIPDQTLTILINERLRAVIKDLPLHAWNDPGISVVIPFVSVAGENRVRIEYSNWNGKDSRSFVPDPRQLGVKYYKIAIKDDSLTEKIKRFLRLRAGS
jgi:hypothetical protein